MHRTECVACRADKCVPTGCSSNLLVSLSGQRQAQSTLPLLPDAAASHWRISLHGRSIAIQQFLAICCNPEQCFTSEQSC